MASNDLTRLILAGSIAYVASGRFPRFPR